MGPLMRQNWYSPVNSSLKRSSNSIRGRSQTWRGALSALREADWEGGWVGRGEGLTEGGGGGSVIVTGVVGALMTVGATTA